MPVKRRVGKHRRRQWGYEHRIALGSGQRYFGAFGSHREPWPMAEAAEAWEELGESLMEQWSREHPCHRPWAWWTIDMGLEYPCGKSRQRRYLHEHKHLTPAELEIIANDPTLLELKPYGRDF